MGQPPCSNREESKMRFLLWKKRLTSLLLQLP